MTTGLDEFLTPQLSDERVRWERYRIGGGELGFGEWQAAGEPTAEEELAAYAFMNQYILSLQNQIDTEAITEIQATIFQQDAEAQLFGEGKYQGARVSLTEFNPTLVREVRSYMASLPKQQQAEIDKAVQEALQQKVDIAKQKMQLPLGAGGTRSEQITAASQAIRNLNIQMGASPDYLKPVIQGQIDQLQQGIAQIQETEKAVARERTRKAEAVPVQEVEGPGMALQHFAEKYGMSPEAARQTGWRYYENPQSEEFANLTSEEENALFGVSMEGMGPPPKEPPPPAFKPPETQAVAGPLIWQSWFERRYPTIASGFKEKPRKERTAESWVKYLEQERARIREQFMQQSPYSRGERPSAFQPKLRTVKF